MEYPNAGRGQNSTAERAAKACDTIADIGAKMEKAAQAARELRWDECGVETKVERLRREVRDLRDALHYSLTELHRIAELFDHSHDHQGRVVAPMSRHGRLSGGAEATSRYDPLA